MRVGDDLYVRSWRGQEGAWFRHATRTGEGRIDAGGVEKDVTFVTEPDAGINDRIDAADREKYRRSAAYVPPMITSDARTTTLRLVPRQKAA
jgi:hypothetical protein